MRIETLTPTEPRDVEYHSSFNQHNNKLAVWVGGEWHPVKFKRILDMSCDGLVTEDVCLATQSDLGYEFPVKDCVYDETTYGLFTRIGVETAVLDPKFGEGFYQRYVDEKDFVNFANGALGTVAHHHLRHGLAYATAKETLPAVE